MDDELDHVALALAKRRYALDTRLARLIDTAVYAIDDRERDRARLLRDQITYAHTQLSRFCAECGEDFTERVERQYAALARQEVTGE